MDLLVFIIRFFETFSQIRSSSNPICGRFCMKMNKNILLKETNKRKGIVSGAFLAYELRITYALINEGIHVGQVIEISSKNATTF